MRPLFRTMSPAYYWILSAVLLIPGAYDTVHGLGTGNMVDLFRGLTSCAMGAFLVYCGWLCQRGRGAALGTPPMIKGAYLATALFVAGFVLQLAVTAGGLR